MNKITRAVLLLLAVGCYSPIAVRAEAPKPRGGCWSRDVVIRPQEESQAMTTVRGTVVAIESNNKNRQIAAPDLVTWVRIQAQDGSQKSIYLGSNQYLKQQGLRIGIRDVVEVQGVETIKPKQLPTIAATTLKRGTRAWKIDRVGTKPAAAKWCQHRG